MPFDGDYWHAARSRVVALAKLDKKCSLVFGSSSHRYAISDPVPEARLHQFEAQHGVQLPAEYRSFLTAFGAGGPGPDYGVYHFDEIDPTHVNEWFQLTQTTEWPDDDDDPLWNLPGLLTVSTSGCGIDWFIEVNGSQPGTLWVDAGPYDKLERYGTFGAWYAAWLDRVEFGLKGYKIVSDMIKSRATLSELSSKTGFEPYEFKWDGSVFTRFKGIPGQIRANGDKVLSFDVGVSWIR